MKMKHYVAVLGLSGLSLAFTQAQAETVVEEIRASGRRALALAIDVTSAADRERMIQETLST